MTILNYLDEQNDDFDELQSEIQEFVLTETKDFFRDDEFIRENEITPNKLLQLQILSLILKGKRLFISDQEQDKLNQADQVAKLWSNYDEIRSMSQTELIGSVLRECYISIFFQK